MVTGYGGQWTLIKATVVVVTGYAGEEVAEYVNGISGGDRSYRSLLW